LSDYEHEDVYNMDEVGLYFRAHPNKTLTYRRVKGWRLQKKCVTLALVVISIGTNKLKLLMIYMSKQPRCLGRWHRGSLMRMFGGTQIKQLG
jgi:hypothetical protein